MNTEALKSEIISFLKMDSEERFEAIFYWINAMPYINLDPDMNPLHQDILDFPKRSIPVEFLFTAIEELKIENKILMETQDKLNKSYFHQWIRINNENDL
jgi:hypothetical protein